MTKWTRNEWLGETAGRRATDEREMMAALRANGLKEGTQEWSDAVRCGLAAMRLRAEKEASTMSVQGPDGEFRPDEDYRAAAAMDVEQL